MQMQNTRHCEHDLGIFSNSYQYFLCFSERFGEKPVRLLMDQRTGRFLGALNENESMAPPKACMSGNAGLPWPRGMVPQKPRMSRPIRMWKPMGPGGMPSNVNQVSQYVSFNKSNLSYSESGLYRVLLTSCTICYTTEIG